MRRILFGAAAAVSFLAVAGLSVGRVSDTAPVVAAAPATVPATVPVTTPPAVRVGVIGDSNTVRMWDKIVAAYPAPSYVLKGTSWPGVVTQFAVDQQWAATVSPADRVVVMLGMNDVYAVGWCGECVLRAQRDLVASFPASTEVLWVNLYTDGEPLYGRDPGPRAREFNAGLVELAGEFPNLRVVDWDSAVRAWGVGLLESAGNVHASEAGKDVLLELIGA